MTENLIEISEEYFLKRKEVAKAIYNKRKTIYCPYFRKEIVLNADGFHHLQFSSRHERTKKEQLFKFSLLPIGLEIIKNAGTLQEFRSGVVSVGKRSVRDGSITLKPVDYWGMVAIIGEKRIKVRVVLRRIGDGNITFWSVMLYNKRKNGKQKLYEEGLEDE